MDPSPVARIEDPEKQFERTNDSIENAPPPGAIPWWQINEYLRCPQRYWYRHHAGFTERRDRSYIRFRQALYGTLNMASSTQLSDSEIAADLEERYLLQGLGTVGYAAVLRRSGHTIVNRFCLRLKSLPPTGRISVHPWLSLPFGNATIGLRPAEVEYDADVAMAVRMHFFKPPAESHHSRHEIALLYKAFDMAVRIEFWYPLEASPPVICSLEERRPEFLPMNSRKETLHVIVAKKLAEVQAAMSRLEAAEFLPMPDDHECRGCGFQYVCPASR